MKKQPKQDCILLSRIIFLAEFVRFKPPGKTAVTIVVIESIGIVVFCASADYARRLLMIGSRPNTQQA